VFFEKEPKDNALKEMPMRGRNLVTGLPEEVIINQIDVKQSMENQLIR